MGYRGNSLGTHGSPIWSPWEVVGASDKTATFIVTHGVDGKPCGPGEIAPGSDTNSHMGSCTVSRDIMGFHGDSCDLHWTPQEAMGTDGKP